MPSLLQFFRGRGKIQQHSTGEGGTGEVDRTRVRLLSFVGVGAILSSILQVALHWP